jgi:hypothetical protein
MCLLRAYDYLQLASHVIECWRRQSTAISRMRAGSLTKASQQLAASSFDVGQGVSREACSHDKGGPLAAVPKQTPAQGHWGGRSADGPAKGKSSVVRRH